MGTNLKVSLAFLVGAATGSVVTWKLLRNKYEQIAQEEINSYREHISKQEVGDSTEESGPELEDVVDMSEYKTAEKLVDGLDYASFSKKEEKGGSDVKKPYVIAPEEFGEYDYYETESLTYYADDVLTDDHDEPIENVEELVGLDSLTRFGEYEDDSVFVRNEKLHTDYEILMDNRFFKDLGSEDE